MSSPVDRETTCGLGPWRPGKKTKCEQIKLVLLNLLLTSFLAAFLQRLASKKVYMFFYGALGIIQGMFFTYLSATLSTLERQFGIKSKEAAYMMSGNEISQARKKPFFITFLFVKPLTFRFSSPSRCPP